MASSRDGKFVFVAIADRVNVYEAADFSSMNPPEPSTFFPVNPLRTLQPTQQQKRLIISKITSERTNNPRIIINHIRSGFIGDQESLVAVGEFGTILVWNIAALDDDPILMESSDFASTWGIAMSPKNFLLATSSNSHAVTIFHYPSRRVIFSVNQQNRHLSEEPATTPIHTHNIPSLDFSPCGRYLTSCSIDGRVVLWSLATGELTRIKSASMEWGWLVRFVPSQQYDFRASNDTESLVSKSFYHSKVQEDPPVHSDVEDITTMNYFIEEESVDMEYDDYNSEEELPLVVELPRNFLVSTGNAHLAEGAGETWPSDSEIEDISDNREYSDYYESESSYYYSDNSDTNEFFDDNPESLNDDDQLERLKIEFTNTEDIALFKASQRIPFDIFYCSSESISVLDSAGQVKLRVPKFRNSCLQRQGNVYSAEYPFGMQFLQHRLAMGEWIHELGIFFVVDCDGYFFVSSPKQSRNDSSLDLNTSIMIPDSLHGGTQQIIGYTLIRRLDEEFGLKLHLYVIYENGNFGLYEIVKK